MSDIFDLVFKTYDKKQEDVKPAVTAPAPVTNTCNSDVQTTVKDESLLVSRKVTEFNFKGPNVRATQTSEGVVEIIIDSPEGSGTNTKTKQNHSATQAIPKYASVSENDDGSISLMDLNNPDDEKFYGITLEIIQPQDIGKVQTSGEITDCVLGRSFNNEDILYQTVIAGVYNKANLIPTAPGLLVYKLGEVTGNGKNLFLAPKKILRL